MDVRTDFWRSERCFQAESREESDRAQRDALLEHANRCLKSSPYYRERLGREMDSVRSMEDFSRIGFTVKDDLLRHNDAFLAVPKTEIVDTCFTSATEGTVPVNFLQTAGDLERLAYNERAAFEIAGIRREDTVAVCVALDRGFMAGIAYFLGGVKLGAHMIRVGASGARHIWDILKVHRPTVLIGVPSMLAKVAVHASEEGDDPRGLRLERIVAIGEPVRDKNLDTLPSVARIQELWNTGIYSTYASTEMASTFCECEAMKGGHMRPELIYVEILDEDGQKVPDGRIGEVVVTPLGVQGMPLMRFRTGDISFAIEEPCSCGRTTRRIGPVLGRKSQLLKYKGTNVFPNAIVSIVEANADFAGCYVEAHAAEFGEDRVVVHIAPSGSRYDLEKLREQFRAGLRVVPEIRLIGADDLNRMTQPEGKRKRKIFFDHRKEV